MTEFSASDHARLMRAGSESSAQWAKLAESVRDLVLWLGQHVPRTMRLPEHVTLFYTDVTDIPCSIRWFDIHDPNAREHRLHSDQLPDRVGALSFCDFIVKYNWLNQVSFLLEKDAIQCREMTVMVEDFLPPKRP